ncbi:MAG TPA: pur operon repressor [Negativicutes bacterium]|nr:pur operon repressor [Negativicutes bacterium]
MDKTVNRQGRRIALTKMLADNPGQLFSLGHFSNLFGVAKSTLSEDIEAVRQALAEFGLGRLETVSGAAGGVRLVPVKTPEAIQRVLAGLAEKLSTPDRIIPGGFLYMSDIFFSPQLMAQVGEIFLTRFADAAPDHIMTVETKGIPLAFATARAFNLPLVTVRRGTRVTEGTAVSINYVTGSSRRIQTMSLPKRAVPPGARVLIIDDFMKAGGTARGLVDLALEVGATVTGIGVLVATAAPAEKLVDSFVPLLILREVDEHNKKTDIRPAL